MPESTRHRQTFDRYYRLGPGRSLARLHEALSAEGARAPSLRTLEEWSRRYHWQDRIAAVERRAREAEDEARVAEVREMQERHTREGLLLQQKGAEWLAGIEEGTATADAAIRAIAEGVRLERAARGDVTARTEEAVDDRLERISDDDLQKLIDAAGLVVEGGEPPPS